MTEKPILFTAEMVRAILREENPKTQTRRVIKRHLDDRGLRWVTGWEDWHGCPIKCPYGKPGDHLWAREAMAGEMYASRHWELWYAADHDEVLSEIPSDWHPPINMVSAYRERGDNIRDGGFDWYRCTVPSIFMPRWACRTLLCVKDVRVERVQDISTCDIVAEGLSSQFREHDAAVDLRDQFRTLWDSINGKRGFGWDENPWVWVVEFEKAEQ